MKSSVITILLITIFTFSGCVPMQPVAMKNGRMAGKKPDNQQVSENVTQSSATDQTPVDESNRTTFSFDIGKRGLQIPKFTDLNSSVQAAYKIKSHEFMLQLGKEKILSSQPQGPLTFGIKGRGTVAFTYWLTQQGDGEPGNYFASNGSVFNAGKGLHCGDAINISGLWWALSPEFRAHYSIGSGLELGGGAGLSLYGFGLMKIKDPWSGYSYKISDATNVGHSAFLVDNFPSFSLAFNWSLNLLFKAPGSGRRILIETGMTGKAWYFGLGTETLRTKK